MRGIKPFLEHHIWNNKGARAFYIRYEDEDGPHIRLRLRPAQPEHSESLQEVLEGWFAGTSPSKQVPYKAEAERFGGTEALSWAEEHFHISTRVALERLARPAYLYGDALFDGVRMQLAAMQTAGLDRRETISYCERLMEIMLPVFFHSPDQTPDTDLKNVVEEDFERALAPQHEQVRAELDNFLQALEEEKFDARQPEWLRWIRGNKLIFNGLGDNLEKALPNLLHFHHNRMGIRNQDEVYIHYILAHTL